jgi:hypothetical protein
MMRILKGSLVYFAIVFGCGFVFGTIRTLWVVPHIGTRSAELLETPIMLVVSFIAARWTVLRLNIPSARSPRLVMGCVALAFLLAAEFGFVSWIRGLSIREYLATGDPVARSIYYVTLGVFAIMPVFVARKTLPVPDHSKIQLK